MCVCVCVCVCVHTMFQVEEGVVDLECSSKAFDWSQEKLLLAVDVLLVGFSYSFS